MAKFVKKTLGTAAGAIGDIMFKTRNGNTYIASRPSSQKTPMDEKSVSIRDKFKFLTKLSGAVNHIFWLQYIWKNSKAPGESVNNKVFKANYPVLNTYSDMKDAYLLPIDEGFDAELISFSINKLILSVKTSALGEDSGVVTNKKVSLQGIIFLTEPYNVKKLPYAFIPFETEDVENVFGEELNFEVLIESANKVNLLDKYGKKEIIANLITKDKTGQPKNVSINLTGE